MRVLSVLSVAALLGSAAAQRTTITDWDADPINGVTAVVSILTDADGDPTLTRTISTIRGTTTTRTRPTDTETEDPVAPTTTDTTPGHRIDAPPTTTYPPMTATTYELDGNTYTWTDSFVSPDAVTITATPGSIMGVDEFRSMVNSDAANMQQNVKTMNANGATSAGLANIISWNALAGWTTMVLGAAAAGYGVMVL